MKHHSQTPSVSATFSIERPSTVYTHDKCPVTTIFHKVPKIKHLVQIVMSLGSGFVEGSFEGHAHIRFPSDQRDGRDFDVVPGWLTAFTFH